MRLAKLVPSLAAVFVTACGSSDEAAEVRALLVAAEQAAEERDTGFFRGALGAGFRDTRGNDREAIVNMIRGYFFTHQKVEIVSRIDEITLEGAGVARAVVHAGLLGQRQAQSLLAGLEGELYRIELELVDDDG